MESLSSSLQLSSTEASAVSAATPAPSPTPVVSPTLPAVPGAGLDSPELATHDIAHLLTELEALKASQRELEAKQYIDASMARFSDLLRWRVEATIEQWADELLIEIVPYVQGMQAALYAMEPEAAEPHLRLIGAYAAPEDTRTQIRLGEGLTGQVARNARELFLTEGHTFQSHTATSLTRINIGSLLILPLVHQEAVEGVLEIGFAFRPEEHLLVLLRRFASVLAASLNTVRSQVRIQKLYEEAQQYSEQMAAQEEEMRQNLEELQATQEEMRRVQAEIQANERRMKEIANNVPGMIYQFRLVPATGEMGFVYASDKSRELLGVEPEQLINTTDALKMHPEDLEGATAAVGVSAQNLSPYKFDVRIEVAGRGYEWFRMESTPSLQADGSIVWNGYMQNIHQQYLLRKELDEQNQELLAREEEMRQNLEELQATQEQMRLAQLAALEQKAFLDSSLNSTDIMFIATDKEGIIKYWNSAAERQLGYSQDEIVNKLTPAVFHDLNEIVAEAQRLSNEYNTTVEPGFGVFGFLPYQAKTYIREWTYVHKNGSRFTVELAISAWKDAKGEYAGLLGIAQDITARKEMARKLDQQQEELMASEEELRQNLEELQATQEEMQRQADMITAVIDGSEDTILALDINYDLLLMNKKLRSNYDGTGLRIERGISVFSLLPPEQHDWYRNNYDRALRGERFTETAHYQFAGLDVHYRIHNFPMLSKSGEIIGIGIIGTDITELVNKEREMARQRDIVNAILESSGDSTLVVNDKLELLVLNEKMRQGLKAFAQMDLNVGDNILAIFAEDQRAQQEQVYQAALAGQRITTYQSYPDPALGGKETHIEIEYFPVLDDQGQVFGAACVVRDITAAKEGELAIARERDIVTSLMNGTEDSISIVDLDYNLLACNATVSAGLEAWMGKKVEMGRNLLDYLPAEQHEYHRALFNRAIAGERFTIEAQYPSGDEIGYFTIDYFPVRNAAGEIFGMASIARNITAQKKAEMNIRIKEALFQNTHDAQWILDGPTLIACNPASLRLFGAAHENELLGKSPVDFSPPTQPNGQDSLSAAMERIGVAMEKGTHVFDWTHRKFTGEDFPAAVVLTRLDFEGRTLLAASIRDRSKEVQAEQMAANEALRQTLTRDASIMQGNVEKAFAILTEQLSGQLGVNQVGVWKLNEAGIVSVDVFTASANSHTSGYELPRQAFPRYFAAIEAGEVVAAAEAKTHPQTAEFEAYFNEHGISSLLDVPVVVGGKLWGVVCLEHSGEPRHWTDNDIAVARTIADFVASTLQNAATHSKLETSAEKLVLSEQRMQAAFRLAKLGYWDWNLRTNEVYFSDTWMQLLGYRPGQFPAEFDTFVKLCHPDDLAGVNAKVMAAIEQDAPYEAQFRMKNNKGKWVTTRATGSVQRAEDGTPLYFNGIQWLV
jgi:PAS domain S-box-containing protein